MRNGKTKAILIGLGLLATWLIPIPKGDKVAGKKLPISDTPPPVKAYKAVSGNEVEKARTPLTEGQANYAIREAFTELEGRAPTSNELRMLSTHSAVETGNWKSLNNYNFGNFRGSPYFKQLVKEFIDGKWIDVWQQFKSFSTASAGALAWLKVLKRNWPTAYAMLDSSNTREYSRRLKEEGRIGVYYTAELDRYSKEMARRYA